MSYFKFIFKEEKPSLKTGLRRLVLVIIALISLCITLFYISNGCIFDNTKFINNTIIKSEQSLKEIPILDFARAYLSKENSQNFGEDSDIKCLPYKGECKLKGIEHIFKNNKSFHLNKIDTTFKENNTAIVKMPSQIQYFSWQLLDFSKILFSTILAYLLYLLIEFIMYWIFSGFNFKFIIVGISILLTILPVSAKRLYLEKEYQAVWCNKRGGVMEYRLSDKARVDCVTDTLAVEFDFADKWAECIGQAIYYGRQTKKQPACVLIMENGEQDLKYLYRLRRAAYRKGVNLKTFTMKPEHVCNPAVVPDCPHLNK